MVTLFFGGFSLMAQELKVEEKNEVEDTATTIRVEDLNFLFDETVTKMGGDFYREFHSKWENPSDMQGVSIFIGEKPVPGMATQVWIRVDERTIFRAVLRPNQEQLRKEVEKALQQTKSYFINYEAIQKQLDSDDYSGNGIY